MALTNRPVIFLAFANDRVDDAAYLRNLPKELDGIRKALYRAQEAGLCEVVERANATVENILNVFQDQKYRDRIAIFHYGGHANGYQLLLESVDGKNVAAKSEGLVPFFAKQRSLKLIFLNGCSSQQQALDLIKAGLPAVIGTSQSINDDIATRLAIRFYNGLGHGAGIDKAWQEAIDEVKIQKGTANMRDLFWDGMEEETSIANDIEEAPSRTASGGISMDRFPWEVHYKPGAEIVKEWNLPEQVGNPLFNLPEIPKKHNLPESPFLFLKRYERRHARVFFGRSYHIRDLYNKITDISSPPIILLYGQSGVGKSSLFDAGIKPRLEETHTIKYIRRDGVRGLVNDIKEALSLEIYDFGEEQFDHQVAELVNEQEGGDQEESTENQETETFIKDLESKLPEAQGDVRDQTVALIQALKRKLEIGSFETELGERVGRKIAEEHEIKHLTGLLKQWRTIEARTQKPLVIILDQVEELFTRPIASQPHELNELLKVFDELFANPIDFPKGKIIMGYRKEFNPEIEEGFKQHALPRTKVFLEHLNRKDIVDIFRGLSDTPELQNRYHLNIEEELPVIVADDLLEDKDSSVAPVLQILMTKMWSKAKAANSDEPVFIVDLYQGLRREGILLDDFYYQQMKKLKAWAEEYEISGLALSVLQFHTTRLGTAGSRHIDEIRERFKHRREDIDKLIEKFKELYLLNESGKMVTGLAHDTIAPLIQSEFRMSERPGQRAARILENKSLELRSNPKTSLDVGELDLVEVGQAGMRYWVDREWELVEKSRLNRIRTKQIRRQYLRAIIATTILIVLTAVYSIRQSFKNKGLIKANGVYSLAEKSRVAVNSNPTLALSMAKRHFDESSKNQVDINHNEKEDTKGSYSEENLKNVIVGVSGQRLYKGNLFISKQRPIQSVDFSEKEKLLVTTSVDNVLTIWGKGGQMIEDIHRSFSDMSTAVFVEDSVLLVYENGNVRVMDKQGDTFRRTRKKKIGQKVKWESRDRSLRVYTLEDPLTSAGLREYGSETEWRFANYRKNVDFKLAIDFDSLYQVEEATPDGKTIALSFDLGFDSLYQETLLGIRVLNTSTQELISLTEFDQSLDAQLVFHPTKEQAGILAENTFYLYNHQFEEQHKFPLKEDMSIIDFMFVPEKDQIAFVGNDGGAQDIIFIYSLEGKELIQLKDGTEMESFGFSPTGRFCYKISYESGVRIWDLDAVQVLPKWDNDQWLVKFPKKLSANARFSSDGNYIIDRLPSDSIVIRDWRSNQIEKLLPAIDTINTKQLFYHANGLQGHLSTTQDMMLKSGIGKSYVYGNAPEYHEKEVLAVSLSADGQKLLIGHPDQIMIMGNDGEMTDSLDLIRVYPYSELDIEIDMMLEEEDSTMEMADHEEVHNEMNLAFSNDESQLLVAIDDTVDLYNFTTKQLVRQFAMKDSVEKIAFSADGTRFVTLEESTIRIWNLKGEEVGTKTDPIFKQANDIRFSIDDQHILIFTAKGVYSWGSIKYLVSLIDQVGLDNPSLIKEVDEMLNERQIVTGIKDPLWWKRAFYYLVLGTIALVLINRITLHFDEKQYLKVLMYSPVFTLIMYFQVDQVFGVELREELDSLVDFLILGNMPFFVFLTIKEYQALRQTAVNRSYLYVALAVIGVLGTILRFYQDFYNFLDPELWWYLMKIYLLLAAVLIPMHLAVKSWYNEDKKRFWIYLGVMILLTLFAFSSGLISQRLSDFESLNGLFS